MLDVKHSLRHPRPGGEALGYARISIATRHPFQLCQGTHRETGRARPIQEATRYLHAMVPTRHDRPCM